MAHTVSPHPQQKHAPWKTIPWQQSPHLANRPINVYFDQYMFPNMCGRQNDMHCDKLVICKYSAYNVTLVPKR